jgi:riboflavin biosynthesis pyrimidine reductase
MIAQPVEAPLTPLMRALPRRGPERAARHPALEARYGGVLVIPRRPDRPTVVSNFVSTLDGVVSYQTPEAAGGGEISGFFEPDRFVMGLLRSVADAVLIGAGTLRAGADERWTPDFIHPPSSAAFAELRIGLGLRAQPITAVVSASGSLDFTHPGLAAPDVPVLVLTTGRGADLLQAGGYPDHADVVALGDAIRPAGILEALADRGAELVVCEGGPHLIGSLLEAGLVDELFLTLAPQLAGRSPENPRLGLVEGLAFDLARAPWSRLVDLRLAGDHLFTRYRLHGEPAS